MPSALYLAALLIAITGLAHSLLGERYILIRLFRRGELPPLFGGPEFTRMTLRFAWHLTSVAWWGIAALIVLVAQDAATPAALLQVLGGTAAVSALIAAFGSRLRHLSWLVLLAVAALLFAAARAY